LKVRFLSIGVVCLMIQICATHTAWSLGTQKVGDALPEHVSARSILVCLVQRSWTAETDDRDFWNPKLRAPTCFNAPAVRSYLPIILKEDRIDIERAIEG
jgi:hypothetical protein